MVTPYVDHGDAIILDNPLDTTTPRLDKAAIRRIFEKHDIALEDVLVPNHFHRAHNMLEGYFG